MTPASEPAVVDQVEVFERGRSPGRYQRRGVFTLDADGQIRLVLDGDSGDTARLRGLLDYGAPSRASADDPVPATSGRAFLDTVVAHFASATYFRTRRTTHPQPGDATPGWISRAVADTSEMVRRARDVSAAAMPWDPNLASEIEAITRALERVNDKMLRASHGAGSTSSRRQHGEA